MSAPSQGAAALGYLRLAAPGRPACPPPECTTSYGVDLVFAGRHDEAVPQFCQALRTSPGIPFAHWGLGGALFMRGRYEEALAEFRAAFDYSYGGVPQPGEALTAVRAIDSGEASAADSVTSDCPIVART